jgi:hypothetical protein
VFIVGPRKSKLTNFFFYLTDATNESWAGWAWSWVPSLMPVYWNEDWTAEHHRAYVGHTYHTGFYVEQASVSLKVLNIFAFIT